MVAVNEEVNLILLDANPLDDIRNTRTIRAVVLRGRILDRERWTSSWPGPRPRRRVRTRGPRGPGSGSRDVNK